MLQILAIAELSHTAWDFWLYATERVAFGFTSFRNYRIRTLLYAGKPNWALLPAITPR